MLPKLSFKGVFRKYIIVKNRLKKIVILFFIIWWTGFIWYSIWGCSCKSYTVCELAQHQHHLDGLNRESSLWMNVSQDDKNLKVKKNKSK